VSLGVKAIEHGFSVAFLRLEDLMAGMKRDASLSPQRLRRRKYMNVALLKKECREHAHHLRRLRSSESP